MNSENSLRVAIVWNGTILHERTFSQTSRPVVTVGEGRKSTLPVPASGLPEHFEMFERTDGGYKVRFTDKIEGTVVLGDEERTLGELVDDQRAVRVGRVSTGEGASEVYEMTVVRGDRGMLHVDGAGVYFQLIEQRERVAGRGFGGVFEPALSGLILLAALLHVGFLAVVMLVWEPDLSMQQSDIPNRFVQVDVDEVTDPVEDDENEDDATREVSGKRAGGEEGEVGKEDETRETEVPDVDGETADEIDIEEVGALDALSEDSIGDGPLANLFDDQDGLSNSVEVAMSGEGDELEVGRGSNGTGLRGTGGGGGGQGPGGIQDIGGVNAGGSGAGAAIPEKERKKVEPTVETGDATVGDFCDHADVRRVVEARANAIKYCYERRLQQNPELKGKVVAQWKITQDGSVAETSVAESSIGDSAVESCILRTLERQQFEAPDGGVCVINYPFVFSGIDG